MRSIFTFLRNEMGAVTIEFVTLVPAAVFLLIFVTDASIIFMTRSEMWNVARDITRRMTTEQITTEAQVRDYASAHLLLGARSYVVDPDFGGDMAVKIAIGVGDAAIFGAFFEPILGKSLLASVTMRREPLL